MDIVLGLFVIAAAGALGGLTAKLLKLPALVGFIVIGVAIGIFLPQNLKSISALSQIGTILLLFSIGIELSLTRLSKFFNIAVFGALIQVFLTILIFYFVLTPLGFSSQVALVLSLGFSVSSTAVLVKILDARGEMDTIHGQIMFGWSLTQDLLVIPIMVVLPVLAMPMGGVFSSMLLALAKALIVVFVTIVLGKLIIPSIIHKVAEANSRELLLLSALGLALGTAALTTALGISPALGAFLAGLVISDLGEHGAIFSEIRPLRDLFVALFFVSLGFIVNPVSLLDRLPLIFLIAASVVVLKAILVFILSALFGYRGKTGMAISFGLAQVGEFAFVIYTGASSLKLISSSNLSLGIAVTLLTLIISPILYGKVFDFWRTIKEKTAKVSFLNRLFVSGEKHETLASDLRDHIIICGYGRVGKWVGKALTDFKIPFIVVDYDSALINDLKMAGILALYGDPTEPEVLEAAGVRTAKVIVLAIPDRIAQEALIAYIQTVAASAKIISRVHMDEDLVKFKALRVDKIVQPEFEAAVEIVRSILSARGKEKEEISDAIRDLRMSHSR